jgi:hypothetical protein
MGEKQALRLGKWSAAAVLVEVLLFALCLALGLGGAETTQISFLVCLLLAPSFVAMMVGVHYFAPAHGKVWTHLGVAFAAMYAVMCTITYYTQLTVVRTNILGLSPDVLKLLAFTPGSFLFSVDMLGYAFMTLATFAASFALSPGASRREARLKIAFFVHGLLAVPTLLAAAFFPPVTSAATSSGDMGSIVLLVWCAIFIPSAWLVFGYCSDKAAGGKKKTAAA